MSKNKKSVGRPKIKLDEPRFTAWDQLDSLIIWASEEYCAEKLGISVSTLQRNLKEKGYNFDQYKHKKKETLRINLSKKQYDVAMAGNVSMLIWLGKNELGQSDKNEVELGEVKVVVKNNKKK